ncbi:hypothetical protein KKB41_00455 [Patescibacteria group bacterium]|nr:hypothetical protein [Patescibacteria group bacterium]
MSQKLMIKKVMDSLLQNIEDRVSFGVKQVAALWQKEDGTAEELMDFCKTHFVISEEGLEELFNRFQDNFEQINGHLHELSLILGAPMQVLRHKKMSVDFLFSAFSPRSHFSDDSFKTKLAFVVLLNFRLTTLAERMKDGEDWSRRQWAEARLADYFSDRVPAKAHQEIERVFVQADNYINEYNFFANKIVVDGTQMFPDVGALICHWGLRDHIKALYSSPNSLEGQRALYQVMLRVVQQTVPKKVINCPSVEWNPYTDDSESEPCARYKHLLDLFGAIRESDEFYRKNKTHIDRIFNENREIPEQVVENILTDFLSSDVVKSVGEFVSGQLGRPLEPFDFWFNQFVKKDEKAELDAVVREKYPTLEALQASLPDILMKLGFDEKTAKDAGSKIMIDPGRSAGHATGAERREGVHRLRIRFLQEDGKFVPDYSTFNVFMHEFGHGVEMYFSLHRIDNNLLNGVPNTAFTEALAFVFQGKDIEVLGLSKEDERTEHLSMLKLFWQTFEMAGVSLVDMRIWRWMYANPKATPEELRDAVVEIANNVWNDYFAPVYGVKDQPIFAIYSHIIDCMLYIPDYFIGALIQHQIQEYLKGKDLAKEVERMFTLGNITPDIWMKKAVGAPISAKPLIESAIKALEALKK